ncbi:MAG: protein kinase [Gemmatimonadales bacterium]
MGAEASRLSEALAGRYDIQRELGSGGMATVFLAKDLKHDRDVAIKVLHPDLGAALGSERFLAEIRTTARLQHPHILPLLDSGEANGLLYYVMPYVTGESLRDRLEREEQLPINAAVSIASEIADALSAAHELGIVHRDIKPENILLRGNHALVADFGIALAVQHAGGARMTQTGLSLGTPQYMSPEQAMGERTIGPRSDIYSLGAVAYEMLAGEPPFSGHSVQAIVAKVMTERPVPLSTIRNTVPPNVENAVMTALAKLPADRFATAAEFAAALANASASGSQTVATLGARERARDPLVLGLGAGVVALGAAVALLAMKSSTPEDAFPYRIEIPAVAEQATGTASLSPDARSVVFVGRDENQVNVLYVRKLDELTSQQIAGTARAAGPVFSPDGKWIAYVQGRRKIMKVPVDGGAPVTLGDVFDYGGVAWSSSGDVVAGSGGMELGRGIMHVKATGGEITELTKVDTADKQLSHQYPVVLADGKTVLFIIWYGDIDKTQLAATSLGDGKVKKLGIAGLQVVGVLDGQLIYMGSNGTLMAVPFDAGTLSVKGEARQLQDSVRMRESAGGAGIGEVFLSPSGALVYARGGPSRRLVWVNQKGESVPALSGLRDYRFARLSPDGKRAALGIDAGVKVDLWILDFASGTLTPVTDDGSTRNPVWSRDGKRILYVSTKAGRSAFWWTNADGSSRPVKIGSARNNAWNIDLSPDQSSVVFNAIYDGTFNIRTYSLDPSHTERELVASPRAIETNGRFSPDGKWMAYQSDESGRTEAYVRSYPGNADLVQISVDGGAKPVWSPDGNRIFYWQRKKMMSATLARDPALRVVSRKQLFEGTYLQEYDVSTDGTRLLTIETQPSAIELVVVPNWISELRAKVR